MPIKRGFGRINVPIAIEWKASHVYSSGSFFYVLHPKVLLSEITFCPISPVNYARLAPETTN